VERALCRQCGAELLVGKKFCTRCGAPADSAPAAKPAPKAATSSPAARPESTPATSTPGAKPESPPGEPDEATTNRWIEEELLALGLPAQYGLPPRRGHEPVIKLLRNSVALGSAQIQEGMLKDAVLTMTQVIDDKMLHKFGYKPLLAAAYYVRGLAYEKLGKTDTAHADYDKSLRTHKLPLAQEAQQRIR
jgi:tetratricopeptide (TPR) repeat protein